jgi:mono/diheme cytochrome c family protein
VRRAGVVIAGLLPALALAPLALAADTESAIRLKDGPGREVTAGHCALCHSLEYIPANAPAQDRAGWQKTVQKMRERFGAPLSDEEARAILDYLGTNYSGKS